MKLILKELRIKHGISQEELADLLNISQQSISKYENGHAFPDINLLIQIADYFKVSIDYLTNHTCKDPLQLTFQESEIIELFRTKSSATKNEFYQIIKSANDIELKSMYDLLNLSIDDKKRVIQIINTFTTMGFDAKKTKQGSA